MKYILAADDEPMNLEIMEIILRGNYEYHAVENGIECLKSIEKRIPDLLLLDLAMPGMDGLEVCKELRNNEKTKKLPIVMVSGCASKEYVSNGFKAGVNDYITKPFNPEQVLKVVKKLIGS
ncbi:MAG: response regulator [Gammaproteobacteria bacterium]|nr:response regulator [Gammaproteobacteria bacterium]